MPISFPPYAPAPSKNSMRSPRDSVTMAFFHERERPKNLPILLGFEGILMVWTLVTLTLKTYSTALRISILLADGRTSNVYLL